MSEREKEDRVMLCVILATPEKCSATRSYIAAFVYMQKSTYLATNGQSIKLPRRLLEFFTVPFFSYRTAQQPLVKLTKKNLTR